MSIDLNHGPLRRVCRRAETAPGRANEAVVDGYRFSVRRPKCPQESTATAMSMSRVARGGIWPTSPTDSTVRAVAPTTRVLDVGFASRNINLGKHPGGRGDLRIGRVA